MDPGLVTSEASWSVVTPTVNCRDCGAQLSVEDSEDHDCSATRPLLKAVKSTSIGSSNDSHKDSEKTSVPVAPTSTAPAPPVPQQQEDVAQVPSTKHRSVSEADMPPPASTALSSSPANSPPAHHRRWSTASPGSQSALLQCNVSDVRVTPSQVAVYSLAVQVPSLPSSIVTVERRFREFYVFALQIYAMFPSTELWQRFPPKTYCVFRRDSTLSKGFLSRRKSGLEDFIHCAIGKMLLGGEAQVSIAQWYLMRLFLNLPPSLANAASSRDQNLMAAVHELTKHARQFSGWTVSRKPAECDTVFEKIADSFHMVKRVATCHFPARAVFDMIMNRSTDAEGLGSGAGMAWAPFVESEEVLSREGENAWTVRTVLTGGGWDRGKFQMISRKTWRVDESGTIAVVMVPAGGAAWDDPRVLDSTQCSRVDCILGGWLITPTPWEGSCSVTWLMQANFGQCDARAEFTGGQSQLTNFLAKRCLQLWAEEIVHLTQALDQVYDTEHYRVLGPLTVGAKSRRESSRRSA